MDREKLNDEALRILLAVKERRLYRNTHGRFEIDQEERPDRHTRELLLRRGLVVTAYGHDGYRLTAKGDSAFAAEIRHRADDLRARTKELEATGLNFSDAYDAAVREGR